MDLPGDEGEACNVYGLCAVGLKCGWSDTCERAPTTCAHGAEGLCHDTSFDCGWFMGPDDATAASEMCEVPAGAYPLGSRTELETVVFSEEFYVDRFEVTNARYQAYLNTAPSTEVAADLPACDPGDPIWASEPPYFDRALTDHPVVCVSRNQAAAFCTWAGKRLPTATEWEAAARGIDGRTYPWAGDETPVGLANCQNKAGFSNYCNDTYPPDTCTGGDSPTLCANTAPIFDADDIVTLEGGASPSKHLHLAGNVAEWVADESGTNGIVRNGSWADFFAELEVWYQREAPVDTHRKTTVGFRCAYSY